MGKGAKLPPLNEFMFALKGDRPEKERNALKFLHTLKASARQRRKK
jgi:hypothetical protein